MRKASTGMPEQGTQTPSPAPDLIPAETKNQPGTYTAIGTANGGTSGGWSAEEGVLPFLCITSGNQGWLKKKGSPFVMTE